MEFITRTRLLMLLSLAAIIFIPSRSSAQNTCSPACYSNETPMPGHGPAGSTDNRRVIYIQISPSWNSSPGVTNTLIWNATECAANQWNTTTNGSGSTTGYYFVINQSTSSPDITIVQGDPTAAGGAGYAETDGAIQGSNAIGPWTTMLSASNLNRPNAAVNVCGTIAHEIGHTIGLADQTNCSPSIMNGTYTTAPNAGVNATNFVQPADVTSANTNLTSISKCTDQVPTSAASGQESQNGSGCQTSQPSESCTCSGTEWVCPSGCPGAPINGTCYCAAQGQWECACDGIQFQCPGGTGSAVCLNGQWACGNGQITICNDAPPSCPTDQVPICNSNGTWECDPDSSMPIPTCTGGDDCTNCVPPTCDASEHWDPALCTCLADTSPIIIDTDGTGFHLTSATNGVLFDFFGNGKPIQIAWTAQGSTNGWLALDRAGDGLISSGKDFFGNITEQPPSDNPNGFLALAVFDEPENGGNGDGIIDSRDAVWPKLLVWIDANHDGISQPQELRHLDDIGIHSIGLMYTESRRVDAYGNEFRYRGSLNPEKSDKVDRVIYDVILTTTDQP